ncbi:LuxR C-terminal-related transcriptional regulator [Yinghuangia aomiensis]
MRPPGYELATHIANGATNAALARRYSVSLVTITAWRRAAGIPGKPGRPARPDGACTPRELQVVRGVVRGLTNEEIGAELHIAPHTVRMHLRRIVPHLGARNRTHLAALAVARGLVDPAVVDTDRTARAA